MKFPLKYFLILSLLLGALGIPLGHRYWKAKQEAGKERMAEIRELEKEQRWLSYWAAGMSKWPDDKDLVGWPKRLVEIEDRLEELTGKRPERPPQHAIGGY